MFRAQVVTQSRDWFYLIRSRKKNGGEAKSHRGFWFAYNGVIFNNVYDFNLKKKV